MRNQEKIKEEAVEKEEAEEDEEQAEEGDAYQRNHCQSPYGVGRGKFCVFIAVT